VYVDRSEDYIGSAQHIADVKTLMELAPDELKLPWSLYFLFLNMDKITDDPESKVTENWPPEMQKAIQLLVAYGDEYCGSAVPAERTGSDG
jgi:hypothetical protein